MFVWLVDVVNVYNSYLTTSVESMKAHLSIYAIDIKEKKAILP